MCGSWNVIGHSTSPSVFYDYVSNCFSFLITTVTCFIQEKSIRTFPFICFLRFMFLYLTQYYMTFNLSEWFNGKSIPGNVWINYLSFICFIVTGCERTRYQKRSQSFAAYVMEIKCVKKINKKVKFNTASMKYKARSLKIVTFTAHSSKITNSGAYSTCLLSNFILINKFLNSRIVCFVYCLFYFIWLCSYVMKF